MKDVQCYGIIPLKIFQGQWQVLMIRHKKGNYWAFPKGHGELNEGAHEAAYRELKEETGLEVIRLLSTTPLQEHYNFVMKREQIHKTVTYFLAEVSGMLVLQKEEILDAKWVPLSQAEEEITFKESKKICRLVVSQLSNPGC